MNNPSPATSFIDVVCVVLVDQNNNILATKRPDKGALAAKWEFPGGKVEPGEDYEMALRREIQEELRYEIGDLTALSPVTHTYKFGSIRLWPFLSRCEQAPRLTLVEHTDSLWSTLKEIESLDWAPADIPILTQLSELL